MMRHETRLSMDVARDWEWTDPEEEDMEEEEFVISDSPHQPSYEREV